MYLQNYDLNRVQREDVLREMEQQRLAQQVQINQPQRNSALNSLGLQMIKLGEWLQQQ